MNNLMRTNSLFPVANHFFDDFFGKDWFDWNDKNFTGAGTTLPSVNVKEAANSYQIEVAAPGFDKADFKVELHHGVLRISAEKKEEKEDKSEGKYTRKEFSYASFNRSFQLPEDEVENDHIDAKYVDGILQIAIPKKEVAKPKEPVMISVN